MKLAHKTILVVGGSSGIGLAVAQAAVDQAGQVIIASSDATKVDTALRKLGPRASGLAINVKDFADLQPKFASLGTIDHLVYTAGDWGSAQGQTVAALDFEAARGIFEVRFWGALAVIKALTGKLSPSGSIILTDGSVAHRPSRGAVVASAMAGSVEHLVRALSVELAPIRVNGVCPGLTRTAVWDAMSGEARDDMFSQYTRGQPIARAALPEEIAEAYLYLLCGSYTTGQILRVDGGGLVA